MHGTFPTPALKKKHGLQHRLKEGVKVLGRKGEGVCFCAYVGRGKQILMHGQKQTSLILTLSEGQGVQSSIPNQ